LIKSNKSTSAMYITFTKMIQNIKSKTAEEGSLLLVHQSTGYSFIPPIY